VTVRESQDLFPLDSHSLSTPRLRFIPHVQTELMIAT
jgi:hypothetical protein